MEKSILEFGAFGDGVYDDYCAFQKALDSGADTIVVPQGLYCISQTLRVGSNISIVADRNAKMVMKSAVRRRRNEFLLSNADIVGGNVNISICGGIWDGNNTAPENKKGDIFDKDGYSGAVLNFVNVKHLTLKNMVVMNSYGYYVRMSRLHHFTIENIDFSSENFGTTQDGLHFAGDVRHGTVKNIRALSYGQTNDDMIALNADDSVERVENLDLCRDTIEDITFENIFAENCHSVIRMLSVTAEIKNLHFKNIFGGFRCNAINMDAARYCMTPLFAEDDCPDGVGKISNILIENFTCYPVTVVPKGLEGKHISPKVALALESHMDNFRIVNFRYLRNEDESKNCPAVLATNLCHQSICADDQKYILAKKSDTVAIDIFKDICFDLS